MSVYQALSEHAAKRNEERANDATKKGPKALPLSQFDQFRDADYRAYMHVNPNYPWAGSWYSKKRFGTVYINGRPHPIELSSRRIISESDPADESTWDPVDWEALQKDYLYWRNRYAAQGHDYFRPMQSMLFSNLYS